MITVLVPGSLQAIAQEKQQSIAETFLESDAIVLIDVSGSMAERDVPEQLGKTRYEIACGELARLQSTLPGKVAVIAFSDGVQFCASGIPIFDGNGTNLAGALEFVHIADDCGIKFILISDGGPRDEGAAMRWAAKFKSPISCVFVGPEDDEGEVFLRKLAAASGGQYQRNNVTYLSDSVRQLLLAA